jgi:uncharacterized protein (DUF1499 family)
LAALAILLALVAVVVIWITGNRGLGRAVAALFISAALLAYPAYVGAQGARLPAIADITTDTADPPRFEATARLREPGRVAYPGAETARQQRAAYPDLATLTLAATAAEVYNAALEIVTKRKWRIAATRAPAQRREGRIEATALTPIMGFPDDVVIRIRMSSAGAVVDMRSASRFGKHDLGANARRVRALLEELDEEVGAQPAASQ